MKTVLITGASDGIGKSIATKLSKQKFNQPEKIWLIEIHVTY